MQLCLRFIAKRKNEHETHHRFGSDCLLKYVFVLFSVDVNRFVLHH